MLLSPQNNVELCSVHNNGLKWSHNKSFNHIASMMSCQTWCLLENGSTGLYCTPLMTRPNGGELKKQGPITCCVYSIQSTQIERWMKLDKLIYWIIKNNTFWYNVTDSEVERKELMAVKVCLWSRTTRRRRRGETVTRAPSRWKRKCHDKSQMSNLRKDNLT